MVAYGCPAFGGLSRARAGSSPEVVSELRAVTAAAEVS